jgi:hypothetical protein
MEFEKIFSGRIDSKSNGQDGTLKLSGRPGGRKCKVAQVMIKVVDASGANVRISAELWHGPDGTVSTLHSTPINAGDPGTGLPNVLSGDADANKIIGEYLHWVLKIKDSAVTTAQWAFVEVYEMRKAY